MTQNAINNTASIIDVDNIRIDGNTISSTDTDGNIIIAPDGAGSVVLGTVATNNVVLMLRSVAGQWLGMFDTVNGFGLYNSVGSPEGSIAANIGSLCSDTSNGALYIKQTDTVSTGWAPIGGESGHVVQNVFSTSASTFTTAAVIPLNNNIPQITDGAQLITQAYTPLDGANNLIISISSYVVGSSPTSTNGILALFKQGTANALSATLIVGTTAAAIGQFNFSSIVSAVDTSARTYEFRAGTNGAGTIGINGTNAGAALFGGTGVILVNIIEVLP